MYYFTLQTINYSVINFLNNRNRVLRVLKYIKTFFRSIDSTMEVFYAPKTVSKWETAVTIRAFEPKGKHHIFI